MVHMFSASVRNVKENGNYYIRYFLGSRVQGLGFKGQGLGFRV